MGELLGNQTDRMNHLVKEQKWGDLTNFFMHSLYKNGAYRTSQSHLIPMGPVRTIQACTEAGWWSSGSCWPTQSNQPTLSYFEPHIPGKSWSVLSNQLPVKCQANINPVTASQKRLPAFLLGEDDVISITGPLSSLVQLPSGCQRSREDCRFQIKES